MLDSRKIVVEGRIDQSDAEIADDNWNSILNFFNLLLHPSSPSFDIIEPSTASGRRNEVFQPCPDKTRASRMPAEPMSSLFIKPIHHSFIA